MVISRITILNASSSHQSNSTHAPCALGVAAYYMYMGHHRLAASDRSLNGYGAHAYSSHTHTHTSHTCASDLHIRFAIDRARHVCLW